MLPISSKSFVGDLRLKSFSSLFGQKIDHSIKKDIFFDSLNTSSPHINIGSGDEISIKELAEILSTVSGYQGRITFNSNFPDGVQRKLIDSSLIFKFGWKPKILLEDGLSRTYQWFSKNQSSLRNN